ncbi:MAG: hypothetical protein JNN30_20075 [Rhodanobacteraceae bacterium]|nr:hypothetical protein [Rhodanobacteraceae bacterium]
MFSANDRNNGILSLLDEKGLQPEQRRRMVAVATALELITMVVAKGGTTLAEEMQRLQQYVDAIDTAMQRK